MIGFIVIVMIVTNDVIGTIVSKHDNLCRFSVIMLDVDSKDDASPLLSPPQQFTTSSFLR